MEDFLEPMGITRYGLAKSSSVPPIRVNEIVHGKWAISADTALWISRLFGTSEKLGDRLDVEVKPLPEIR